MTACAKCGTATVETISGLDRGHDGVWRCHSSEACALRAELRDVKAERDAWMKRSDEHVAAWNEAVILRADLATLRAAALRIAAEMATGPVSAACETWARELREAAQ